MRFLIEEPVPSKHKPMTYEVEIRVMHGDADGYNTFTIGPFIYGVDEDALTSLVETLDRIAAAYPSGRGGNWEKYGFQHIEGFYSWFHDSYARNEKEYLDNIVKWTKTTVPYDVFAKHHTLAVPPGGETPEWGYPEWPHDVTMGDEGLEADLDEYSVYFYDEFGTKHRVKVEKDA